LWDLDWKEAEGRGREGEGGQRWRMVLQGEEVLVVGDGAKGSAVWLDVLTGEVTAAVADLGLSPSSPPSSLLFFPLDLSSFSSSSSLPPSARLLLIDASDAASHRGRFLDKGSCSLSEEEGEGGKEDGPANVSKPIYYHTLSTPSSGGAFLQTFRLIIPASSPASPSWPFVSSPIGAAALPSESERVVALSYPDARETSTTPTSLPLGDGALLLRYLNPHLLALASTASLPPSPLTFSTVNSTSEGGKEERKERVSTVYVTVMDTVAGRVLHRVSHFHAQGPVKMRMFENWLVYSYWNCRAQRTEVGSITFYDGFIDKKGMGIMTTPEFKARVSSLDGDLPPVALQQTFVFPHPILALGSTLTARGITTKALLVGYEPGQVLLLDRRFLDPRRPTLPPSKAEKAEGLPPYSAHLPLLPSHVLTYNHILHNLHTLHTSPSSLESTTLLLGLGDLDLFFTRLHPSSKPFDLLPETFNHVLVSVVLVVSVVGVWFMGRAAQAKTLREAWA
ncbi:er membrane protein complex subunit partial, partial [Nannochloropsis oceanica]